MNPLVLFLPVYRASVTAYLLGLVLLATLDAMRMQFGLILIPSGIALIAVWFARMRRPVASPVQHTL
ncbi:hypothetical protein [uncultured Maricaulis sp.]|mgnify:CR=1 FL=1|uniref:hypothetical protein n=1 Tax=uncultured Maricaulis sp. TaxID=174710 RepID=UPI0030D9BC2D|tara:strand:+ start:35124 stop:35324 length:201 start_codon:yes stop_codon:yes gene_type:complete